MPKSSDPTRSAFQSFETADVRLGDLKPSPYNPRSIDPEARRRLKDELRKGGLAETLIWNKRTGHLVGGHQRHSVLVELETERAAKAKGDRDPLDTLVTVAVIDVDDAEEKRLNVALNNPNLQGRYEAEGLYAIFAEGGVSAEDAGFGELELEELFADHGLDTALTESLFRGEDPGEADAALLGEIMDDADAEKKAERQAARENAKADAPPKARTQTVDGEAIDRDDPRAIKDSRQTYAGRAETQNQADYTLLLVFRGDEEKRRFCEIVGHAPGSFNMAGEKLAVRLGEPGTADQLGAAFARPAEDDADDAEGED
ncbi:ParB N-terminal domain-containing protein [Alienimonas sp. DA493]|uniref:ParB N-terminal domain-containing protein n=1 Tax=Alienimonas sp. DA493 TaxID=3373605 RepID=UPI0037544547